MLQAVESCWNGKIVTKKYKTTKTMILNRPRKGRSFAAWAAGTEYPGHLAGYVCQAPRMSQHPGHVLESATSTDWGLTDECEQAGESGGEGPHGDEECQPVADITADPGGR